jgi:5-methylcytosine-specific restriction endonuclease McrA
MRGITMPATGFIATHCKRGHEFTPENTLFVNNRGRMCKICHDVRQKRWREDHKVNLRVSQEKWSRENPGLASKRTKQWRKNNPERTRKNHRAKEHTRRACKVGNGGSFTAKEFTELCDKCGNICLCCKHILPLTADHVIPLSKGGTSNIENIQPLCSICNSSKGTKSTDYRNQP